MGKTVKYHPVSLQVLRGALVYGGFTVGKFVQHNANRDRGYASYEVEIKTWPSNIDQVGPELLKAHLNACFAADVTFVAVWITRSGKRMARVHTYTLLPDGLPTQHAEEARHYDDLTDEEKADIPF